MKSTSQNITLLQSHGLRATSQRVELLEVLTKASLPLSIPELQELTPHKSMDNATFYRGLETLVETGLVRKINLQHGHTDYELIDDNNHHHHIVCRGCEKIEDINWCPDKVFEKEVLKNTNFSVLNEHALEFFGLCKTCA